jgi:amino acid adenylation domain-containing protein/FkbH-like protein
LGLRAQQRPDRTAYTFLEDGETNEISLTYGQLELEARKIGHLLQSRGATGERVLLIYPQGLDYIAAFFGCLYAGAVAVPIYPPRPNRGLLRVQTIIEDSKAALALTTSDIESKLQTSIKDVAGEAALGLLATDDLPVGMAERWREPSIDGDTLAFIQYTSGSTSAPKGVMLSHNNLLRNQEAIRLAFRQTPDSIVVGWLPLYHDMGMIGNILQPLYLSGRSILMSPAAFLQSPIRWLKAISHYRATTSGGPNFAYDLCVLKTTPEQRATLDLSSWGVAFNGAEPIRESTLQRFAEAFAPHGFRREASYPCYGLAEATLLISADRKLPEPSCYRAQSAALEQNRVEESFAGEDDARALVSCGLPAPDTTIKIVDPKSLSPCSPGEIGEIWVSGPGVAQGYWNRAEETEQTFRAYLASDGQGPFLRTADLGFIKGGELFVTGRLKDLIIIRGRNHYPQDIELTVAQTLSNARPNCCAAFSVEAAGEERLVLVQEVERHCRDYDAVIESIRRAVADEHEVEAYAIALLKPASIPKTSSGKIQRHACRRSFLEGTLNPVRQWQQPVTHPVRRSTSTKGAAQDLESLKAWLAAELALSLGIAPTEIDAVTPVIRYGLDSLKSVDLLYKIESAFDTAVPLARLLEGASVAEIADTIFNSRTRNINEGNESPGPTPSDSTEAPVSYGQQALWLLHQLEPASPVYNMSFAIQLGGKLDVVLLERSINELIKRHGTLRATFHNVGGAVIQRIAPAAGLALRAHDLEALPESARQREADRLCAIEARHSFDLTMGPLLRCCLLRLSNDERLLILTMHHIISDGWSWGVFLRELSVIYVALVEGRDWSLGELPFQYSDFARWQRERLAGEALQSQSEYWRQKLGGNLTALRLPSDATAARHSARGAIRSLTLPGSLLKSLKALSRERGATLFMTTLAVFQMLLSRYSEQDDIIVGAPVAGRDRADTENLIGFFINTLALRTDCSGNPCFGELLQRVRKNTLEALANQDLPFEKLVEDVQPERDPNRNPVFEVMFNFLSIRPAGLQLPGVSTALREPPERFSKFLMTLYVEEQAEGLRLDIVYQRDTFSPERISTMLDQYRRLAEQIVEAPDRPIQSLSLLTEASRALLPDWGLPISEPPYEIVPDLLARTARLMQSHPAVCQGDESHSYGELALRSGELARLLLGRGLRRGSVVSVRGSRSFGLIASVVAAMTSGGVVLTIDPSLPPERQRLMLEEAGASYLLDVVGPSDRDHSAEESIRISTIRVDASTGCASEAAAPADSGPVQLPKLSPDDAAYIFFTSGTTGIPKGVLGLHKGLAHFINWQRDRFAVGPDDRSAQLTGLSFDVVLRDIFLPLTSGATLCLPQEDDLGADRVTAWLRRERITILHTVPSLLQSWLAGLSSTISLPSLRRIFFAGEPLTDRLVRLCRVEFAPAAEIVNLYGPTETTLAKCFYVVAADPPSGVQPVGWPLPQTQALISSENLEPCGIGELGEIVIRTPFRTAGYINAPDEGKKRFAANPYSTDERDLLYRTGDRGRYRPDGSIEIVGRLDHQVKIRGVRVEPNEVAATLMQHTSISECVVVSRKNMQGEYILVAYVAASKQESISAHELRAHLSGRLPSAMIPSAFVFLQSLPLTPNGKVDRSALPDPEFGRDNSESIYEANHGPIEELLIGTWSEVLGVERVEPHDNFFDLGGHSLLATQVASRIRGAFKIELPLRVMFETPTVAGLAVAVRSAMTSAQGSGISPIVRIARDQQLPLSFAQQRVWFMNQVDPVNAAYNMSGAVRLKGPLNAHALSLSIATLLDRHETLRSCFPSEGGRPLLRILPAGGFSLVLADLSGLPLSHQEKEISRLAHENSQRPFDLASGPLFRGAIIRASQDEHVVLVAMHHIVSDGWSVEVFIHELAVCYQAISSDKPVPLPDLPIQYADFAHWQREWLKGDVLQSQLSYWSEKLGGAPASLDLPTDHDRPADQTFRAASRSITLDAGLVESLRRASRREMATTFMTMLVALKVVLSKWTGQDDVIVGTVIANRNRVETENLIGCFMNYLALRSTVSGGETGREFLSKVKSTVLEAYAYQDCPFEKVVEALNPGRKTNQNPFYNVGFLMQNYPRHPFFSDALEASFILTERHTSPLDLRMVATDHSDGMVLRCEYNTDLFEADTVEHLMSFYGDVLEALVREPDASISTIVLPEALKVKADRARARREETCIAVAATFTAEPVEESIQFWMQELEIPVKVKFAPYNQVFQQLLDSSSLLSRNSYGVNVVLARFEDWVRNQPEENGRSNARANTADVNEEISRNVQDLTRSLKFAAERSDAPYLVCLCPAAPGFVSDESSARFIKEMEAQMARELSDANGLYVVTASELFASYPVAGYYDERGDRLGHVPYTQEFFTALGTMISRKIRAIKSPPFKAIVLDCDETIWRGVCGEDGASCLQMDSHRTALQEFMVRQYDAGMLLCLCSKNNEDDVLQVFDRRPDMPLGRDHFVSWRINWSPKSENIKSLSRELQIGLDQFIFIDDNPVECAEVQANCPEVLTLQLPAESAKIPVFLNHVWAFDHLKVTEDGKNRTRFYQQNVGRKLYEEESLTIDDFLAGLDLNVRVSEVKPHHTARVTELVQRTNQFNFTCIRSTEGEIRKLQQSGDYDLLMVEASDRFGDYGAVGVMIFKTAGGSMDIHTFLLSCRAMGKRIESRMMAKLVEIARQKQIERITAYFTPTGKNQPALNFLRSVGEKVAERDGNRWVFSIPVTTGSNLSTGIEMLAPLRGAGVRQEDFLREG